jgi:hypothetical protein
MTLLGSSLSISASNNPFDEKEKNYEQSSILITKELTGYSELDIASIQVRTKKMVGITVGIWKV